MKYEKVKIGRRTLSKDGSKSVIVFTRVPLHFKNDLQKKAEKQGIKLSQYIRAILERCAK
jgi:hypothetical protein